jgi:hypothetical protein
MTRGATSSGRDTVWNRRRFLTTAGTAAGIVLAGCSGVTNQSFAASPVTLPDADQRELLLAEATVTPKTITLDGPADTEVEITNQAAVYKRADGLGGQ